MKVIECVPNFSEGKREDVFLAMKDSFKWNKKLQIIKPGT